ncbi:MAG: amino acid--tRNA ligase-related protein [Patescibacteria group bacterium]
MLNQLIPIASTFSAAAHNHYGSTGLAFVPVPQIVGITGACENVDTLFKVKSHVPVPLFFSQTGQLTLEQALQHYPGVYTTMVSGRDEEIEDERHLRQFLLTEEEFDWSMVSPGAEYDEEKMYSAMLEHIEAAIKAMSRAVVEHHGETLESAFGRDVAGLAASFDKPFHRISYQDALKLLAADGFPDLRWGADLTSAHEAKIVEVLNAGQFPRPVFIMRYPKEIKFFNMKVSERDDRVVLSADCIFPYAGEGVGSAVREHDGAKLTKRLLGSTMYRLHLERGGTLNDFGWYLEIVRSGRTQPHAGYGIGNERVLQYLLGANDIRQVSIFSCMARQTCDWVVRQHA